MKSPELDFCHPVAGDVTCTNIDRMTFYSLNIDLLERLK